MSSYDRSHNKQFISITVITMLMFSGVAVASKSVATDYAASRADVVAAASEQGYINPLVGYRAATWLNPGNHEYQKKLADEYLNAWKPDEAMSVLANVDDDESLLMKSRASLELDRGGERVKLESLSNVGDIKTQTELISKYEAAMKRTSSEEGSGVGYVGLATELVKSSMPQSALRVLERAPSSISREILIAQIELSRPGESAEALRRAEAAIDRGLAIDGSHTTLHELKRAVYVRAHNKQGVEQQTVILKKLQDGTL